MNPIILEAYGDNVSARLRAQGWTHLQVTKRGQHLVIYSQDAEGDKVNRTRFTWRHGQPLPYPLPMRGADGARLVKRERSTPY